MSTVTNRLAALEGVLAVDGCGVCREWPRRRYLVTDNAANVALPPSDCPSCGRQVVMMTRIYVLVPEMEAAA